MQRGAELTHASDLEKATYVDTMQRVFLDWFETHDAILASHGCSAMGWPRRSHVRQLHVSHPLDYVSRIQDVLSSL